LKEIIRLKKQKCYSKDAQAYSMNKACGNCFTQEKKKTKKCSIEKPIKRY